MDRPKMILFDYGNTLLYEPNFNLLRGEEEVFKHVIKNPNDVTAEQANEFDARIFKQSGICRKEGFEIHEWQMMKLKYEYLEIELDISYKEAERILWDGTSCGACMPYITELLDFLKENGIRSGVISNIGWSGQALTERINRLLPDNQFEFIIASSEYGIRKPNTILFELALRKAGLRADEVWYCGNSIRADIYGANSAGIFPVFYEELTIEDLWAGDNASLQIDFDHLHINDWREMIDVLKSA